MSSVPSERHASEFQDSGPDEVGFDVRAHVAKLQNELEELRRWHSDVRRRCLKREARRATTAKLFLEQCCANCGASVLAHCAITLLVYLITGTPHVSSITVRQALVAEAAYAVFASLAVPVFEWLLRGSATDGTTFFKDLLKLLRCFMLLIHAWAWKGAVQAVLAFSGGKLWPRFVTAVVLTLIIATAHNMRCYRDAQVAVEATGPSDTLCARYLLLPGKLGLAIGWAWNEVMTWGLSQIQQRTANPFIAFGFQTVYFFFVGTLIIYLTARWIQYKSSLATENVADTQAGYATQVRHVKVTGAAADVFLDALSFVFAWAFADTLSYMMFNLMVGCPSQAQCSYQSNFIYALMSSFILSFAMLRLSSDEIVSEFQQTYHSLLSNAFALTVGWAWMNYFNAQIETFASTGRSRRPISYAVLLVLHWLVAGSVYHVFLKEQRFRGTIRDEEIRQHLHE